MAHPIATEFVLTKKLLAWGERAVKQGLDLSADLQPSIDNPAEMERLVRYIQAGAPEHQTVPAQLIAFDEPESHRVAREIMGSNFHGIATVQRHFGAFTEEELAARREIPFSEGTLRECAEEFILLPTHSLDLCGIHAAHPERFVADPDQPWFGARDQREKWSSQTITAPWLLLRKKPVPDSWNKSIDAQQKHLKKMLPQERLLMPHEFGYAALVRYLERKEKLCEGYIVRFAVQSVGGYWVSVDWDGGQLYFIRWHGFADGRIASASARTS